MPDILHRMLSGARPGEHAIRKSGEFSNVTTGADYFDINKSQQTAMPFDPEQCLIHCAAPFQMAENRDSWFWS